MGFYETRKALGELSSLYESSVLSEKKKDDSYLETDMKKRQANNEKARKDMEKMGTKMKNPHFEEVELDENRRAARAAGGYKDDSKKQTDPSKAGFTGISGSIADIMRQNKEIEARDKAKTKKEGLDPVGQEDADIDNDGDTDSSDKYLHKRRKAISKAIKAKKKTVKEQEAKIGGGNLKTLAAKATTRIDADVDGDVDTHDPKSKEMGEYVPGPGGKKLKPKVQKEAFHDWRTDLREIISTDDEDQKEVKEKTVKNKVVIDPELKLENFMGGEVLELTESETCPVCGCDPCQCLEGNLEFDEIIESVYIELIDEGYTEDEVEYGIESAITLEEGYYDSAVAASKAAARKNKGSLKDRIKSAAKKAITRTARTAGKVVRAKAQVQALPSKAKAKAKSYVDRVKAVAKKGYESGRGPVEKKTSYRNVGAGRKEKIGEDVQQIDEISANLALTASQKADEMRRKAALAGDRETAAKKAQQATRIYKGVGPRRAKERMAEASDPRDEAAMKKFQALQKNVDQKKKLNIRGNDSAEQKARLEKKRGMKLDDHPQYKKEEVEVVGEGKGDPCWDSHKQVGMKKKGGRLVPNCVPKESTEDSLRDRRMERGGVDGNTRYDRAPKAPNTKKFGTGKTALQKDMEKKHGKGKSAMDIVRAEIRAKHGKGAIMDTKKK